MVDEWTKNHAWGEPIGQEMHKRGDGISGAWPLLAHMTGGMDVLYYGFFSIGSPAQNLSIEIDTGSADMWLATSKCPECTVSSTSSQYPSKRVYRSSSSSTSQERREAFHVGYGSGGVCGSMTSDKMEIMGFKVDAQDFGGVFKQSKSFQTSPNSGLLGLAFGTVATSKKLPFFENLLAKRQVPSPYFGVYLTRGKTMGSELCLGCVNTSKWVGNLYWVGITSKTYWTVPLTGFRTQPNTRMQFTQPATAVVDTGTSLIYFPPRLAAAFYSTIPHAREATDISAGSWVFPCNTTVNVAMEINGVMLEMSSRDFILGRAKKDSSECVGAVVGIGDNGSFPSGLVILGAAFLKNWYTVYDYSHGGRVGFGRLAPGN
ncbi:acid protease [Serendipita vermifera]|nr:acid protease [Serendipita vermifera]